MSALRLVVVLILLAWTSNAAAQSAFSGTSFESNRVVALPPVAQQADIDEHLGQGVDGRLTFTDQTGRARSLDQFWSDDKPIVVVLAYYRCPMLCGLVLRGLVEGLRSLDWKLGEQYRALTISFDPRDTPEAASAKRASTIDALEAPAPADAWPFLVSNESQGRQLADALGFRFAYDERTDQYAHPAVVFVLSPKGKISRYLYGVRFSPRDLRLALLDAGEGKVGSIVDRVLLTCYRYDPTARAYGPYIFGFLRLGAVAILLSVSTLLALLWRGERRRARGDAA